MVSSSNSPPSNTWDSMSQLKWIPYGKIDAVKINFPSLNDVCLTAVYIECVEDDHGLNNDPHIGQYNVGDRFPVSNSQLNVIHNGSSVKIVNPGGPFLTKLPKGNGSIFGSTAISNTFDLNAHNYEKYRLRCFASHTREPLQQTYAPFWDNVIENRTFRTLNKLLTVPHGLGVVPDIVEINFVCKAANNGFNKDDVIPLKFVGGRQPNGGNCIWTTSATSTNVFLSITEGTINVSSPSSNTQLVNLINSDNWTITVYVKKDYPNEHGAVFPEASFSVASAADLVRSPVVPYPNNAGTMIGFDMVLINTKNDDTAYKKGETIYCNQSGGSNITDYKEQSQFQFYDTATKRIEFQRTKLLGQGAWKFCHGNGSEFNMLTQPANRWNYKFRWEYDNTLLPHEGDTGWLVAEPAQFYGTTKSFNSASLGISDGARLASKVDISVRPVIGASSKFIRALSGWHLASLKGGGKGRVINTGNIVWNNFTIMYNIQYIYFLHYNSNAMTIPNYNGRGPHPTDSAASFDSGTTGALEFRISTRY